MCTKVKKFLTVLVIVTLFTLLGFTAGVPAIAEQTFPTLPIPDSYDAEPINDTRDGATYGLMRNTMPLVREWYGYINDPGDEDWGYVYLDNQSIKLITEVPIQDGANIGVEYYAEGGVLPLTSDLRLGKTHTTHVTPSDTIWSPAYYYRRVYNNGGSPGVIYYTTIASIFPPIDFIAPSTPSNLRPMYISSDRIDLAWDPSTDTSHLAYLVVNMNPIHTVGVTSNTSYSFSGLAPSTTYSYAVGAYDVAGNMSANATDTLTISTFSETLNNTPEGPGVSVPLGNNVELSFDNVDSAGTTTAIASDNPPLPGVPSGLHIGGCWLYLDISTTASFTDMIQVTLPYDPTLPDSIALTLKMYHWNDTSWEQAPSTVNTINHTVTGSVSSLSPFILGYPEVLCQWLAPISNPDYFYLGPNSTVPIKWTLTDTNTGAFIHQEDVFLEITGSIEESNDPSNDMTYVFSYGEGSENMRIDDTEEYYIVNFSAKDRNSGTYSATVKKGD